MPQQGLLVWFTGSPCSGKTTLSNALKERIGYPVVTLDGDDLRKSLSTDLSFSTADRSENVRRAGALAVLIAGQGIPVIVSLVSPFREDRDKVRISSRKAGVPFIEVHVDADLATRTARDVKGHYAQHLAGNLPGLTGADAPYESPLQPEIYLNTGISTTQECLERIWSVVRSFK